MLIMKKESVKEMNQRISENLAEVLQICRKIRKENKLQLDNVDVDELMERVNMQLNG